MNADGSGQTDLALASRGNSPEFPAWSPDGSKIAFAAFHIWTIDAQGSTTPVQVTSRGYANAPDWQAIPEATPQPKPPDTTPPTVTSTFPSANAKAVAPTVNLKATFSEDMMASTINKSTFELSKKGSTTKVSAAVGYSAATDKATLNPTEALQKGATDKAVVTSGAKDAAGNPLDQNTAKAGLQQKRWVFAVKKKK